MIWYLELQKKLTFLVDTGLQISHISEEIAGEEKEFAHMLAMIAADMFLQVTDTMHTLGKKNTEKQLAHNKKFREYGIRDLQSTSSIGMTYCYHCGKKLPKSLRSAWFDVLARERNIEADICMDKRKIPKEFRTEEWWKKRNL